MLKVPVVQGFLVSPPGGTNLPPRGEQGARPFGLPAGALGRVLGDTRTLGR
jgi:hypothetical protein